jgi:hypothetical protein
VPDPNPEPSANPEPDTPFIE